MTHNELVKRTAEIAGVSLAKADLVLSTALLVMAAELRDSGEVSIKGIGKLKRTFRAARPGRNPRTGESVLIPERQGVKFKASSALVL